MKNEIRFKCKTARWKDGRLELMSSLIAETCEINAL